MHTFLRLMLRFKLIVLLLAVAVVAGGAWSATQLRQQLFPDIAFPLAAIKVDAPGIPPAVLDDQVATPLAASLDGVAGIRNLTTVASDGVVTLYGELELGVDVDATTKRILAKLGAVDLPAGVGAPKRLGAFTEQPVLISAIVTKSAKIGDLTTRVDALRTELLKVDGVAKVEIPGAVREQVQVQLSAAAETAGLTPAYVLELLGPDAANSNVADLEAVRLPAALSSGSGKLQTVGDVASVRIVTDPGAGFAIANGSPSVAVRVQRKQDANEVGVVDGAQKILSRFDADNADLQVVTLSENATGVKASIKGLLIEGILGAIGAVLVIFLFLRSGRGTLIAAISIPTSLVFGLLVGYWLDLTLDIITLAGLTIAIGRVIDDAIVVIENISKHIERGESVTDAVVNGTAEVFTAIVASTAATVAVFLPLGFLGGFISSLFRSFSIIVAVSLAASLLVAITVIPVLAELMFRRAARDHTMHTHERGKLERWVRPATAFGLRHRVLTVGLAVLSVVGTGALVASGVIPTQFLPDSSVQQVYGTVTLPPAQTEDQARAQLKDLSSILDNAKGVVDWQYSFGAETIKVDFASGPNTVTFVANLDKKADGGPIVQRIRTLGSAAYPDSFTVAQLENGPPAGTFQANIKTTDPEVLRTATERLVSFLKQRNDLNEVGGSQGSATIPQLQVTERTDAPGKVDVASLRRAVAAYSNPAIDEKGDGPSIAVLPPATAPGTGGLQPATLAVLPARPVDAGSGSATSTATIGDLAQLSVKPQLAFISRSEGKLTTTVNATIEGKDTAGITKKIKADIKRLQQSGELGNIDISYEGDAAFVQQMFHDLLKAIAIAVLLVLIVLVLAFRSLFQPIAMLAPVLFSTFGAFIALALTGNALGLPAMIGQLLLIGIVVANAILLVDAVVRKRRAGASV
ncbi:MAG: efflux RND transporter permease subunit, partial [Thermoleophilia bacterium]|nr:efflux RND transporter permease subunit [Thermoleophilia bacterium]